MSHTPGPWRLAKEPPKCGITVTLYGYGPRTLGTIHTGSEEYMANARLIAAAPVMLASLRRLVPAYAQHNGETPLVLEGRAAIALADGCAPIPNDSAPHESQKP